jgi:hypothetical protein
VEDFLSALRFDAYASVASIVISAIGSIFKMDSLHKLSSHKRALLLELICLSIVLVGTYLSDFRIFFDL